MSEKNKINFSVNLPCQLCASILFVGDKYPSGPSLLGYHFVEGYQNLKKHFREKRKSKCTQVNLIKKRYGGRS